jgi:hypothetical protein
MILYCQCGNAFQVSRFRGNERVDTTCLMCGRQASTQPSPHNVYHKKGGMPVSPHAVSYAYRTSDGMGGKVPKRGGL